MDTISRRFLFEDDSLRLLSTGLLLSGLLFVATHLAAASGAGEYRLAGIMAVGRDYVAFLALPGGGQVLVRTGSVIGSARVVEVQEKSLRLSLPDRTLLLSLEGTGGPAPEVRSAAVQESRDDDKNRVYMRTVESERFAREMATASKQSGMTSNADPKLVAAQRIGAVLDLPPGSRLLKIRGEPVTSADAALRQIQKELTAGDSAVYLDIDVGGKQGRVYLQPVRD